MTNEKIIHNYCEKCKLGSYFLLGGLLACIIFLLSPLELNSNIETIIKIILFLFFFYLSYYHLLNTYSLLSVNDHNLFKNMNFNFILSGILTLVIFCFSIYLFFTIIR
tara:strand:- start:9282 stop:9605 length:324 start_codon:yes stop_codon:yes gene_type:complete